MKASEDHDHESVVVSRAAVDDIGRWLSAALEDPRVCDEMKKDIRAFFEETDVGVISKYQKVAAILAFDIDMMKELAEEEPMEALDFLRDLHDNKEVALENPHDRYASMQFLLDISRRQ